MKKIYLLLPFLALLSCSTAEEDTSEFDNPILVTRMVQRGKQYTFSYNGAKITEMNNTTDNWKRTYTYTGDLITQYVDKFADGKTHTTSIEYNSNQKITKKTTVYSDASFAENMNYYYTGINQIKMIRTVAVAGSTKTYTREAITYSDGSLKSWTETVNDVQSGGTVNGTGSMKLAYDGGYYPFRNVAGYTKMVENEGINGSARNTVDYSYIVTYPAGKEYNVYKNIFDYQENSYPKKETRDLYQGGTLPVASEITTYEYNHL